MTARSAMVSEDIKQQLIAKLIKALALLWTLTKPQILKTMLNL